MGWRGILAGALALAALERLVAHPAASGRVGGLFEWLGEATRRFLSPGVPAFAARAPAPAASTAKPGAAATAANGHKPTDILGLSSVFRF